MWHRFVACYVVAISLDIGTVGITTSCSVCETLVYGVKEGLRKTEKSHFAGGNTAWETEKLGRYRTSETRLVEVIEEVCRKSQDDKDLSKEDAHKCHSLLEEHEEEIESWYFHKQQANPDLVHWLCHERLSLCCPAGRFGPQCEPCPAPDGGAICFGNGQCDGDGSREGTGKCKCSTGYQGKLCRVCASGFYSSLLNSTHSICQKCTVGCSTCTGPGVDKCTGCAAGYAMQDGSCLDVNECDKEPCNTSGFEVCHNTPGSYRCDCAAGYKRDKGECKLDVIAPPETLPFGLTPELVLRSASVLGLLIGGTVVYLSRSLPLACFYALILALVAYIEWGSGANWIANVTSGQPPLMQRRDL